MPDALYQERLTRSLKHFSARLDDLLLQVRCLEPPLIPSELLDELASTTGELMLVLAEYQFTHRSEELVQDVISNAHSLRELLRSRQETYTEQLAEAVLSFNERVGLIIRQSKHAA
jgi:hypothetical protein